MKNHSLFNMLKSFGFLFIGLGVAAFFLFNGVKLMNGDNPYRAVVHIDLLLRGYTFKEIDKNPTPYLLATVFVSAFIGALWTAFFAPKYTDLIKAQILAIPWICLFIASPIWGFIWSFNFRSPQYFMEHFSDDPKALMWLFYKTDAMTGLSYGWLSALQSFPINILSYVAFCSLLMASRKLFSNVSIHKSNFEAAQLPLN
jgi:hypothetical protein